MSCPECRQADGGVGIWTVSMPRAIIETCGHLFTGGRCGSSRASTKTKAKTQWSAETILYISDQETNSHLALTALTGTGYEVVSTDSSTQAVALLFIMRSATAVVLNHQAGDRNTLDLARTLRGVRPDVPIILLCGEQVNHLPSYLDACVDTGQSIEKLTAALRRRLTIKGFQEFSPQF
jgi:CheY-like chemotaxis protein